MAIKRKTVREDGKIFWAYKHKNGTKKEVWLSPKVFERWDQVRKNYVNKKYKKYLEQQNELPEEDRNYRGKCDPQTGLYFIRVSTSGKPVFGSKEELEKYINQNFGVRTVVENFIKKINNNSRFTLVKNFIEL